MAQYGQSQPSGVRGVWARASRRQRAAYVGGAVVVVIILAAVFHPSNSSADDKPAGKAASTSTSAAPAYRVLRHDDGGQVGRADLLLPGATKATAMAAIRDYARTIEGPLSYSVQVVRSDADSTYVCSGEWRKDSKAAAVYGGKAGLSINCP